MSLRTQIMRERGARKSAEQQVAQLLRRMNTQDEVREFAYTSKWHGLSSLPSAKMVSVAKVSRMQTCNDPTPIPLPHRFTTCPPRT